MDASLVAEIARSATPEHERFLRSGSERGFWGREIGMRIATNGSTIVKTHRRPCMPLAPTPEPFMAVSDPQESLETEKPAISEVKPDAQHDSEATADKPESPALPRRILVIDLGGTKVKVLASGETEPRKSPSGPEMSPQKMVEEVNELARGWQYDAISLGYPGLVGAAGPRSEAGNLGSGWVGFDFAAAFKLPVRVLNDAAMQALGSYEGARCCFSAWERDSARH